MTFHEKVKALRAAARLAKERHGYMGVEAHELMGPLHEAIDALLDDLTPPDGDTRMGVFACPKPYEHPTRVTICNPTCPRFNNECLYANTTERHDKPGPGCPWGG